MVLLLLAPLAAVLETELGVWGEVYAEVQGEEGGVLVQGGALDGAAFVEAGLGRGVAVEMLPAEVGVESDACLVERGREAYSQGAQGVLLAFLLLLQRGGTAFFRETVQGKVMPGEGGVGFQRKGFRRPETVGSDKFTITGANMNRDAALLALNLGMKLTPNTQLRLQYAGEWGKQEKNHGGSVVLEVKW